MAVSQLPQAPYRQDRRVYLTPDSGDVLFSEVRDCTRSEIPEYGTPHPNPKKWPDHKLVFVKTVDIERDGIFEFFYAADRENQDLYNFSSGYRNIVGNAGGREFRVVQRSYVTPRADFQPLDIPFGTPMPNVPEGKFDDIEYVFFDRQQQPIDQQELNSLYVAEVHTYVEKAFLDDKLSYAAQRNDPLPAKFQIQVPEQSTEQLVEGKAKMPTLTESELSVKEDQLNPDVKLVRTISRDRSTLPISLDQKTTTNEKQLASVTQTVQTGDTIEEPSATVDIQSEALGDGTYVVTKTEVPELFDGKSITVEKPDVLPERFRAERQNITESINKEVSDTSQLINLLDSDKIELQEDELAIRRQKVNNFVYSEQIIKRKEEGNGDKKVLEGSQTYVSGTVANVKEEILSEDNGDSLEPDRGFNIEQSKVTPLGGGKYLKETVSVENYPELYSSEYDTILQSSSITKQTYVDVEQNQWWINENIGSQPIEKIQPINENRSLRLQEYPPKNIDTFVLESKTTISLSIPPVLKSISVIWDEDKSDAIYQEGEESGSEGVEDGSISFSSSANISGSASATPILDIKLESVWASDVPATNYFFFTKYIHDLTSELNKVITGKVFNDWPFFKPKTYSITAIGKSVSSSLRSSISESKSKSEDREANSSGRGRGTTGSVDTRIDITKIGPCLCAGIRVEGETSKNVTASVTGSYNANYNATAKVEPTQFEATSPMAVPSSGYYVISARAEPYKWGYYRVVATTINASQLA